MTRRSDTTYGAEWSPADDCQHADAAAWQCDHCGLTIADILAMIDSDAHADVKAAAYASLTGQHTLTCACGLQARTPRRDACVTTRQATMSERLAARKSTRARVLAASSPFVARFDASPATPSALAMMRRTSMRGGR